MDKNRIEGRYGTTSWHNTAKSSGLPVEVNAVVVQESIVPLPGDPILSLLVYGCESSEKVSEAAQRRPERLRCHQQADTGGSATKCRWRRSGIAQFHERVVHQRVVDRVKRHDGNTTKIPLCAPGSPPWPPSPLRQWLPCLLRTLRVKSTLW